VAETGFFSEGGKLLTEALTILAVPLGTYWMGLRLLDLYRRRGAVKANYQGLSIAPALGPALLLGFLAAAAAGSWLGNTEVPWIPVTVVLLGVALYGLWDDFLDETVRGFTGHFRTGLQGGLSAGLLKVITALLVALIFTGALPAALPQRILALFLILLSANGINLLDRRPGRAIKVFFFLGLLLILFGRPAAGAAQLLLPLMAAVLALAPFDFMAEGMLGDCGANLLGAALGAAAVLFLEIPAQLFFAAVWSGVNLISERVSISSIIDQNRLLRYLDKLGRREEKLT
jgi:UDP-GlcNAc:undecaprenyl-phosphate/decaprenyl-phosphate GlcNAc-1-phosphate transferase